jgi:hypothetical protein
MIDIAVHGLKMAQDVAAFASKLEPGDILLASPQPSTAKSVVRRTFDNTVARASRYLQGSDKTHSLLYTGGGKIVEARIGLGVRKLPLVKALKGLDVTALRPVGVSAEARLTAAQRALEMVKTKPGYALKGVAKALLREHNIPIAIGAVDGVICSDLITRAYDAPLTDKPKDAVLPVDFLRSTRLRQVAEHLKASR